MEPDERGNPRTIPMSWIQHIQRFIDLSHGHHSMARWIPPPTGFQGHLLNPYLGHRMEIVHQNEFQVVHASVFRDISCGKTRHTFTVEEFAKLTPMWKISHSLTKQNPSFQNWPKIGSLVHGTRVEGHPYNYTYFWIQWCQWFIDPSHNCHSMARWIPPPTGF